jgi:eukaryotic-like serine/threonine-protein kinase
MKSLPFAVLFILFITFFYSCKKTEPEIPSSEKYITSFKFAAGDNTGITTTGFRVLISNDSIFIKVPSGTAIKSLVPAISFKGVSIVPSTGTAQDFTDPVHYTITAEDGSTKTYIVVMSFLSNANNITKFAFLAADNIVLSADVTGTIGADTILVALPVGVSFKALVPAIEYSGVSISPANNLAYDFSTPVPYTITAEDGSIKKYVVIVSFNATVFIGSSAGTLYALNAATGAIKWSFNTNSPVNGNTFFNGVVYAVCSNGSLYAINEDGTLKWTFSSDAPATFSVASVHYNMVYFYMANNLGNFFYALDEATGSVKWQRFGGRGIGPSKPTIANQKIYYGTDNGEHALDALTGEHLWLYPSGLTFVNPAFADGKVYTSTEGTILSSLDANTGTLNWFFKEPGQFTVTTAPAIHDNVAYVGCHLGLYAINVADGSVKWKYGGDASQPHFASPVISNGLLFTSVGKLIAIDIATGISRWSNEKPTNNAAVANNDVFAAGGHELYMLDAASGMIKWAFVADAVVSSDPCVVDNNRQVYFTGDSGDQN